MDKNYYNYCMLTPALSGMSDDELEKNYIETINILEQLSLNIPWKTKNEKNKRKIHCSVGTADA